MGLVVRSSHPCKHTVTSTCRLMQCHLSRTAVVCSEQNIKHLWLVLVGVSGQSACKPGRLYTLQHDLSVQRPLDQGYPISAWLPTGGGGSRSAVIGTYKGLLHEYRALQEELRPWTNAFMAQFSRKPNLADVERTGAAHLPSTLLLVDQMPGSTVAAIPVLSCLEVYFLCDYAASYVLFCCSTQKFRIYTVADVLLQCGF